MPARASVRRSFRGEPAQIGDEERRGRVVAARAYAPSHSDFAAIEDAHDRGGTGRVRQR